MTSVRQPWRSQKRRYMRARSPANRADSSPPVPARISRKALRSSSGSRGSRAVLQLGEQALESPCAPAISSRAISAISGSPSISRAAARSDSRCSYCAEQADDLRHLGLLARQRAVALHVGDDLRVGQVGVQLGQPHRRAFELLAQRVFHGTVRMAKTAARAGTVRAAAVVEGSR
jgi:hypothetical protein